MTRNPLSVPLRALLGAALLAFGPLACGGGDGPGGSPGPAGPGPDGTLTTAVELAPLQPPAGTDFEASFRYTIAPPTVLLGAYQVEVGFNPALVRFVSVDPAIGAGRVPNTSQAGLGSIVVAGASATGFTDGILFRGTFRALAAGVSPASFQLDVGEAVDSRPPFESLLD
jgi:hypothetical protein